MKYYFNKTHIRLRNIHLIICLLVFKFIFINSIEIEERLKMFHYISNSCNDFSSNLFQVITAEQNDHNVLISSLSAHITLSLLYQGSNGITNEELKSALYLFHSDEMKSEVKNLLTNLNSAEKIELEIANTMFIENNVIIFENFLTTSKDNFQTFIEKFNSKNGADSADQINAWIMKKTKGRISSVIQTDDIDEDTKVIILNTLYFKSNWLNQFESQLTEERIFYNINNIETYVPTMFKILRLPCGYIESLDTSFVKIDYLNEQFEMIILLPKKKYGLYELEKNFNWNLVTKATCSTKEVELLLPKFKVEATINLKTPLKKLGINSIFEERANLSLMSDEPLYVNQILQKLYVEVDENGSEAAVATVAQMRPRRMIVDTENFVVDHPFIFVIHHKPSNIPLFISSIRKLGEKIHKDEL